MAYGYDPFENPWSAYLKRTGPEPMPEGAAPPPPPQQPPIPMPYNPPSPPGPAEQLAGTAGNLAGSAGAMWLGKELFGGGAAASGAGAGAAPSAPVVVGGQVNPLSGGLGAGLSDSFGSGLGSAGEVLGGSPLGLAGAGALAIGGTYAGRELSENLGGNAGSMAWSTANIMNPVNQAMDAVDATKDIVEGKQISDSAAIGLSLPTMGASLLYNPVVGMFDSKKAIERERRDAARNALRNYGIYADKGTINLADGLQTKTGEWGRPSYETPEDDPEALTRISLVEPLVFALMPDEQNGKTRGQIASEMANALTRGNGDVTANLKNYWQSGAHSHQHAYSSILKAYENGVFGDDPKEAERKRDSLLAELDLQFGKDNPNASPEDTARAQASDRYGIAKKEDENE